MAQYSKGISLVEVLVALLVLSIGFLGAGLMALKSLNFARAALNQTQAIDLAQMQQERILAVGLGDYEAWKQRVNDTLPQGEGSVSQEANGLLTITVSWQSYPFKSTQKSSVAIQFTLPCHA